MPRATRSQRPSETQQPATQNARAGRSRRRQVSDEEEEEENSAESEGGERGMDVDSGAEGGDGDEVHLETRQEIRRKANNLVRLALFNEQKRMPLRREEISKKILAGNSRAFNHVFTLAQEKLRSTFGIEFVELPSRAGLDQELNGDAGEDELNDARKATGMKKKTASLLSKTYILRSTLSPILIEHACVTDEKVLEEEIADAPSDIEDEDQDEDDAERHPKSYGALLSWSTADQLGELGILYVILALVLVSGRVISDVDLRAHLKRLRLPSIPSSHPIHHTAISTTRSLSTDAFLSNLLKQGFLDRQQVGDAGKSTNKGKGKRVRTQAEDADEGRMYEWRWGPRAHCEVGEEGIGKFVAEFMVNGGLDTGDGEEGDEGGEGSREERKKQEELLARMTKGVERAAGGKLAEVR
ncbi:MAGE family-domain-containing protein [Crucibulum laeve]|uniref:MAGE family-domain-containing protein n=1 Tax=Crucibulum laeve TaxID=68775 RepID=A0A5C3LZH6_9AGAR|nr:MAGE family-domain-containing protein [Crucibulum laeve]